jgi:nucleoside-diphosphate-sugar epimerase
MYVANIDEIIYYLKYIMKRILITGSEGLIGKALRLELEKLGMAVHGLDLLGLGLERGDVLDASAVDISINDCDGVIHLAATSRVVGEQNPELCWKTNVEGLRNVLNSVSHQKILHG